MRIIPTVLATTPKKFTTIFDQVTKISREIHIDIMDGKFVPTTSIPLQHWPDLRKYQNNVFEAHLMVQDAHKWVPKAIEKGVKRVIVHLETLTDDEILGLLSYCKKHSVQFMLAAKTITRTSRAEKFKKKMRGIMLMGVQPGYNKSPFVYHTVDRVAKLRKAHPKMFIQVDGGANINTVKLISAAGANAYASGSFVSLNEHPHIAMQALKKASISSQH